jgi:probable O-glycosylation ligase (exosortase A-associated)
MSDEPKILDYEPLARSPKSRLGRLTRQRQTVEPKSEIQSSPAKNEVVTKSGLPCPTGDADSIAPVGVSRKKQWMIRRGHTISFVGLFLFTAVLYFRPYELAPAFSWLSGGAFWIAMITLVIYIPTQLALEGNLTVRPREINLLLLLVVAALLSVPLAISPIEAWGTFTDSFIKVVLMFVVMVNVVRTRQRLNALIYLAVGVSLMLSFNAIADYRSGSLEVGGTRIGGSIGGMFANPNDLAVHLVIIVPIVLAFVLTSRSILLKILFSSIGISMIAAVTVTFSRGGFLGLLAGLGFFAWRIGRRNRMAVIIVATIALIAFPIFAPGDYGGRIASIFNSGSDLTGSSGAREALLVRSALVTLRHPAFGIGMGNFHFQSIHEQVTHNSYTQVGSEMGIPAMLLYTMLIFAPYRKLQQIQHETFENSDNTWFYYSAIGLQAGLISYLVASFFASLAYLWYLYYLIGYAVCLRRLYASTASTAVSWP